MKATGFTKALMITAVIAMTCAMPVQARDGGGGRGKGGGGSRGSSVSARSQQRSSPQRSVSRQSSSSRVQQRSAPQRSVSRQSNSSRVQQRSTPQRNVSRPSVSVSRQGGENRSGARVQSRSQSQMRTSGSRSRSVGSSVRSSGRNDQIVRSLGHTTRRDAVRNEGGVRLTKSGRNLALVRTNGGAFARSDGNAARFDGRVASRENRSTGIGWRDVNPKRVLFSEVRNGGSDRARREGVRSGERRGNFDEKRWRGNDNRRDGRFYNGNRFGGYYYRGFDGDDCDNGRNFRFGGSIFYSTPYLNSCNGFGYTTYGSYPYNGYLSNQALFDFGTYSTPTYGLGLSGSYYGRPSFNSSIYYGWPSSYTSGYYGWPEYGSLYNGGTFYGGAGTFGVPHSSWQSQGWSYWNQVPNWCGSISTAFNTGIWGLGR